MGEKRADVIERQKALNFEPDPEETELSELEQYKTYIENIPQYRTPSTRFEPTYYSTYEGSKEAYRCTTWCVWRIITTDLLREEGYDIRMSLNPPKRRTK